MLEMTVILVAAALLFGIILVGKTLTRAAELQAILSDVDVYKKNFQTFKEKYQALPGDMANATTFWGTDTGCPNSPYTAAAHTATCDGDGNGRVTGYEMFRAWQHLANAAMVPSAYPGMSASISANQVAMGVNVPKAWMADTGYVFYYQPKSSAMGTSVFPGEYGHVVMVGKQPSTNSMTMNPFLTPVEAYSLDNKIDDGIPGTGIVSTSPNY